MQAYVRKKLKERFWSDMMKTEVPTRNNLLPLIRHWRGQLEILALMNMPMAVLLRSKSGDLGSGPTSETPGKKLKVT